MVIRPDDPGLLHGDGIFETIHLRSGVPWLLAEHLARMTASARLLALEFPSPQAIDAVIKEAVAVAARRAEPGANSPDQAPPSPAISSPGSDPSSLFSGFIVEEAALRLILTRGSAFYATVSPIPAATLHQRRNGITVLTANAGISIQRPPWSLSGAKSLSYAENLAARRWAEDQQADDAILISTEGWALESPTASLIWLTDGTLCTVPPAQAGILPGTTAAHLLSRATELNLKTDHRMITRGALKDTEAIWLASSLRGLAEVITLDGTERARSPWTGRLHHMLGF